jgi:hypothetical protein
MYVVPQFSGKGQLWSGARRTAVQQPQSMWSDPAGQKWSQQIALAKLEHDAIRKSGKSADEAFEILMDQPHWQPVLADVANVDESKL